MEVSEQAARTAAERHYGEAVELTRDPDVLDTWFSSALWPFSTLGWPEETRELARYYPTDVLVTGFDIIFFWVARMMMMGLKFMGEVPFRTVYIHALVRDAYGQKMSKTKGNIIDPMVLIERYGGDALRFTLAALSAQGRDIKLSEQRVEGYRNFATKLWNAARFALMNEVAPEPCFDPLLAEQRINRWAIAKLVRAGRAVDTALEEYKFNEAAGALYQFTWHEFCDWYVEFAKPVLAGDDAAAAAETRATIAWVVQRLLALLHPFMPFVTEALWEHFRGAEGGLLIAADWPVLGEGLLDEAAEAEIDWVARVIGEIRAVRSEMNVPAKARVPLTVKGADETTRARLQRHRPLIERLARLESVELSEAPAPAGAVQVLIGEATAILPLGGVVDLEREQQRLQREIERLEADLAGLERKLANEQFLAKAPPEVVEEQKERREEARAARDKLAAALERLEVA